MAPLAFVSAFDSKSVFRRYSRLPGVKNALERLRRQIITVSELDPHLYELGCLEIIVNSNSKQFPLNHLLSAYSISRYFELSFYFSLEFKTARFKNLVFTHGFSWLKSYVKTSFLKL